MVVGIHVRVRSARIDELITDLGHISALRVTSVMSFKRVRKPLRQIARELNVDAVGKEPCSAVFLRVRIEGRLNFRERNPRGIGLRPTMSGALKL